MPVFFPLVMEAFDNRHYNRVGRFGHVHGGNELQLICAPGTTVIRGGSPVKAPPGTLFLHRAPEEHGVIGDGAPTRMLIINYEPDEAFEASLPALGVQARRVWHLDDGQFAAYEDLFTRLQVEQDGQRPGRQQAASAWLRLLLVMVARFDDHAPATANAGAMKPVDAEVHKLRRAIDLRRQGSTQGGLNTLVENYDSLRHRFRRTYGESPGQMLARLRIEKAKGQLVVSDMSMSEIAKLVGYARQHEFARAFRRVVGCTPTAFRRQHRH